MYKLKFNQKIALRIPDVQKAHELQDDIAKLFSIRCFHEFEDFVEEDQHISFADDFARAYGFYASDVQDKLRTTALKILTDLNESYREYYADYHDYLEECDDDAEIMYLERELVFLLDRSLYWGCYDLANAVIAVRQAPIKKQDLVLVI